MQAEETPDHVQRLASVKDDNLARSTSEDSEKLSRRQSTTNYLQTLVRNAFTTDDEASTGLLFDDEFHKRDMQAALERAAESFVASDIKIDMTVALPTFMGAMDDIISDSFNECFQAHLPPAWNWNIYLFPAWVLGAIFRYCFLFPVRVVILLWSIFLFLAISVVIRLFGKDESKVLDRERRLMWYLANAWVMVLGGVIRYDGIQPHAGAKVVRPLNITMPAVVYVVGGVAGFLPLLSMSMVYVANHTSIIDYVVCLGAQTFAVVGQHQPFPLSFFQDVVLKCLNCIWFDRKELKNRALVRKRIQDHVNRSDVAPLLIFPEGTCVNNRFTVQFKKGAFELDAIVYPISMKYNNIFVDAFWDTRNVSFTRYLFNLMTSWALICDVTFLDPQVRREDETPIEFAMRVQKIIAESADVKITQFDGYFKHIRVGEKFIKQRQAEVARTLKKALHIQKALGSNGARILTRAQNEKPRKST